MSRILLTIVCIITLMPLAHGEEAKRLHAGAATSNISPPLGISLAGHMRDRKATHIHDEIHARCLVIDNGDIRIALATIDSCMVPREVMDKAKALAETATGIPAGHMLFAATHTHTAPTATPIFQSDPDPDYQAFLAQRIADGVQRAVNNLAPAEMAWGMGSVPDEVFNRRWHLSEGAVPVDPFGRENDRVKMNPPRMADTLLKPAGPTDPSVPFIAIRHVDGRPLAIWSNYALHYVGGTGAGDVSADYFGYVARMLAEELGDDGFPPFVGLHSNGASGDINNINFQAEAVRRAPYEQMERVARKVADSILGAWKELDFQPWAALDVADTAIMAGVRKPDADDLEAARALLEAKGDEPLTSLPEIYARETVLLDDYPDEVSVPLQVLRIGEGVLFAIPCEVFVEIGLELKSATPLPHAMVVELANGYNGYLPTADQHALGGYETWRARSSYLAVDTAWRIVETLVGLMDEVVETP
jgi:hypothetical protein